MDRGTWCATVHGVTKSQTRLSDYSITLGFPGGIVVKNLPANTGAKPHAHDSALELSYGEAQSVRRYLNTNGGTLWLWSSLPTTGALGP